MRIELSAIVGRFEDGISASNYQRIGRLIRIHGTRVYVKMVNPIGTDASHDELTSILILAEKTGRFP